MTSDSRPFNERELAVLEALLDGGWLGSHELRDQLAHATRGPSWFEGSPSFDIRVDPTVAGRVDLPQPLQDSTMYAFGIDGGLVGWIFLWAEEGYLSALEFAWITDEMPSGLPIPERLARDIPVPPPPISREQG